MALHKWRFLLLLSVDFIIVAMVTIISFWLRFDFSIPGTYFDFNNIPLLILVAAVFRLAVNYVFGLYNRLWHYASLEELVRIILSVSISGAIMIFYIYLNPEAQIPRSIVLIHWTLSILGFGGIRFAYRLSKEGFFPVRKKKSGKNLLIVGAGDAGEMVLRELSKHQELEYNIVGLVDDNQGKLGMQIHGIPVLGTRLDLEELIKKHQITEIIIAIPTAPGQVIRQVSDISFALGVNVRTLPGVFELISGEVSINQIREVRVEDLLSRDVVRVNQKEICEFIANRRVLVTGGGGSIGSELMRQIAQIKPAQLMVLDLSENNVYHIEAEIKERFPALDLLPLVGSVQDEKTVRSIFELYRPEIVFHAAAYKHVPMMEINAKEAVKNNVLGTLNLTNAANDFSVERFVFVSTDKAVNPTSVMGATKRFAEIIVQNKNKTSSTEFVAVRFGNVLNSEGSVVPLFKKQIKAGKPLTVTHPETTRYFMTIAEAVQLVIAAGSIASGGEIFILDMGEPVKILDLAQDLIKLSGLQLNQDIQIKITGLRDGEKLHEELAYSDENISQTKYEKIFITNCCQRSDNQQIEELKKIDRILKLKKDFPWEQIYESFPGLSKEELKLKAIKGKL